MSDTPTIEQTRSRIASDKATLERQRAELDTLEHRLIAAESAVILGEGSAKDAKRLADERNALSKSVDELQIKIRAHEGALVTLEERAAETADARAVAEIIAPNHREMQVAVAAMTPAARELFAQLRRYTEANQRIRAAWPFPKSTQYRLPDLSASAFGGAGLDLAALLDELKLALWAASGGLMPAPSPLCHHSQIPAFFDTRAPIGASGLSTVPDMLEEAGFGEAARELRQVAPAPAADVTKAAA
jgi:hypothetical protein